MKFLNILFSFLLICMLFLITACSTHSDVCEEQSDFQTNQLECSLYYEQAKSIFQYNSMYTRGVVINENEFQRYSPLGENFSNITKLSEDNLTKIVNEVSYNNLVTLYENSLGSELFEFVTIQEYKQVRQVLRNYLLAGGHSTMKLMSLMPQTTHSKNLVKLSSYAAYVLDEYIEDHILNDLSLEIVSDITSCEDI